MKAHTKETQAQMTPDSSLQELINGNQRFTQKKELERDLMQQVEETSTGQYPHSTILSCIDSRVSSELIFDQGIGDIFNVRIAGNIVNEDILGSMEFACKLAGTKLIVVLGHTSCGAIKGACDDVKLGNLTNMLANIKPAVAAVQEPKNVNYRNSRNTEFVDNVATKNVHLTIARIMEESPVLAEMQNNDEIKIIGAIYDINTGAAKFLD